MNKRGPGTSDKDHLLKNSIPIPETGCWIWLRTIDRGYGTMWDRGHMERAHRVSYRIFIGPIPEGMYVCHRCDIKSCINPAHLFLGTQMDNIRDAVKKGRSTKGGRKGLDKSRIWDLRRKGLSLQAIASLLGCSQTTIHRRLREIGD